MKKPLNLDLRPMALGDSHHLINIDNKRSEFPWTVGDWQCFQRYFPEWEVSVVTLDETPVGFTVIELSKDENKCYIHKFAVLPKGLTVGIDLVLLNRVEYRTVTKGLNCIEYPVSESSCNPGDPYDVSEWLLRNGFRCEETVEEMFEAYGSYYDGFLFRKPIE